jgi:type II secretory pathway predicted ATPase ExeA
MNNKKLLALYGLNWNPFLPTIPAEALWTTPGIDTLLYRIEDLVMDGGFALICGEPGVGKSKTLQLVAQRMNGLPDVVVGVMERPQSSLSDFYREMGDLFGVNLSPANRYGGFKTLRERWRDHIKSTLFRPVLLIDEAQEMFTNSLNELRLLTSTDFDSQCLLTTVICGDMRLPERFRSTSLVSLGSRIRIRMIMEPYGQDVLLRFLEHSLIQAGAPHLMTRSLMDTLAAHCSGNLRLLSTMAAELLHRAAEKEMAQLDEGLFFDVFSRPPFSRHHRSEHQDALHEKSKI